MRLLETGRGDLPAPAAPPAQAQHLWSTKATPISRITRFGSVMKTTNSTPMALPSHGATATRRPRGHPATLAP